MRREFIKYSIPVLFFISGGRAFAQQKMGDNLGSHKAKMTLDLNNNNIKGVSVFNAKGAVIGTASQLSNESVALQFQGTNKAMLISRVTNLLSSSNPSIPTALALDGMMVYDIATSQFYFRQGGAWVKFESLSLGQAQILIGDVNGVPSRVSLSGDVTLSSAGEFLIGNNMVASGHLSDSNVSLAKLSIDGQDNANKLFTTNSVGVASSDAVSTLMSGLTSAGQMIIGSAAGVAQSVSISGDGTLSSSGQLNLKDLSVSTTKINNGAVRVSKLGTAGAADANKVFYTNASGVPVLQSVNATRINSAISNTEYQALDGVTSEIQTQLNGLYVPIGSVVAWFPTTVASGSDASLTTLPANYVECLGQVLNDAASPLNGKTMPSLNGRYLIGTTSTTGVSLGANTRTLTVADMPSTPISAVTGTGGGFTPAGTVTIVKDGLHRHNLEQEAASLWEDINDEFGGNGYNGDADRIETMNSAGAHVHDATFSGNALPTHTHTASLVINANNATAIDTRPKSVGVRWIIRVK